MLISDCRTKNAMVIAQGLKPSDEVMSMFGDLGMVIYRVIDQAKSLVVGDVPGAMAVILPDDSESGKSLFIRLAHDLAIGYLRLPSRCTQLRWTRPRFDG